MRRFVCRTPDAGAHGGLRANERPTRLAYISPAGNGLRSEPVLGGGAASNSINCPRWPQARPAGEPSQPGGTGDAWSGLRMFFLRDPQDVEREAGGEV